MPPTSSPVVGAEPDMDHEAQRPKFTNGPAKFIMTNDGKQDCLALLVTETFLDQLNIMFKHDRDLENLRAPLNCAKSEIDSVDHSIKMARDSLKSAKGEAEKDDIRQYLMHQEPRLRKFNHRRDDLEEQCTNLKREISCCGNYAHYVLETAMESADLLKSSQPIHLPRSDSDASVQSSERPLAVLQKPAKPSLSPEEAERQVAYDELRGCWYNLEKVQRLFNERKYAYQEELADHQRRCTGERCSFNQSDFDRGHLVYGMELTGALIEAEASFERAKQRAEDLGINDHESESEYDHRHGDSASPEQTQAPASMPKRSFIEAWRANVSEVETIKEQDEILPNHDDAGFVEISDSMSARDCSDYRKKIDRWQEACGLHEGFKRRKLTSVKIADNLA